MQLRLLFFLAPVAFALPGPSIWRDTPQCDIDLAKLSEDIGASAEALWGADDTPFPTDPAALTQMHDELIGSLKPKYSDPCQQQAIIVEVGEFFTSQDLNTIQERDLSTSTELALYDASIVPRGWKISCRKCKKLVQKIVAIVAPLVCADIAVSVGVATGNPLTGSVAGYLCMNASEQFVKKGKVEIRVKSLRLSSSRPLSGSGDMARIEMPDGGADLLWR